MKNFIDTNMALGYTFSCDKWHDLAKDFLKIKMKSIGQIMLKKNLIVNMKKFSKKSVIS